MANENKMNIIEALVHLRNDLKKWVANNLRVKLDKNLGADNANKILSTDAEGNIITTEISINNDANIEVDSELSSTSENPVQNKVVTSALEEKLDKNLGEENANKILSIDAEGNIIPIDNTTGGGGGGDFEQVQADWEENDATSNAYIKNRPFYVNGYIVPFATLQFQKSEYNNNYKSTKLINLVAEEGIDGKEYIVEWDGVEYTTTCRTVYFNTPGAVFGNSVGLQHFIGNSALLNSDIATSTEQDTGEPFALQLMTEQFDGWNSAFHMDLGCVVTNSANSAHTIRISGGDNIVKLNEKYLPDGIATEDFVREQIASIEIPEGGNGGPVHWNDVTGKPFIKENKHIFVDHSKVDTSIAFTSTELDTTFIRLTEETLSKDELIGATITATFASGDKISGIVSESSIQFEDNNGLILFVEDLPIAVFYKAGQYTVNIYGVETTVQVPKAGSYTTDYAVIELASSEITTNVTREYLDNKCLSILEISSKPTEFLHEIEFTNEWNDLIRLFTYFNPIDEETFNAWNANTEPVIVNYDDVEYICMPQNGDSGIAVGNWASFEGGTGNNEPFAITYGYENVSGLYFAIIGSTVDTEPTAHSVAIYLQDEAYKIKDEYLEDFIKETNSKIKVYQVGDLSEIIETPTQGDQAIVTSTIKDDLKSYTAYIWDETLNEGAGNWVAMDGNYNAENVYFANDMMVTKEIGYITLDKGRGTIPSKGKNLVQVFEDMFVKEQNPTTINPSVSITLTGAGSYEVGTTVTGISYSASFEDGEYSYGPEPTGVTVTDWEIKDSNDNTVNENAINGDISDIKVTDSTNYFITAKATHTAGDPPLTNKGNNCTDASKQIVAGTKDKKSGSITGYRKTFYGTTTTKADTLGSSDIRALSGKSDSALANGSKFDITIPVGAVRVIIAYPASLRNLTSVLDKNDSNANIVSSFIKCSGSDAGISVLVYDATGNSGAMVYKVYIFDYAKAITVENTYEVTI